MKRNIPLFIFSRLLELIVIAIAFWYGGYWVIHVKDKLNQFSTPYDQYLQRFDTVFIDGLLAIFIIGYYLHLIAQNIFRKRLNGPGIDLLRDNQKIVALRIAVLFCLYISTSIASLTLLGLSDMAGVMIFVIPVFPLSMGVGPCYVFYGLADIFSWKYGLIFTAAITALTLVAGYFHFPATMAGIFAGIPFFKRLIVNYEQATRFIKTGRVENDPLKL